VLRSEVRKTDATYKVVKNTVVRLAVEGTEMEGITPFLTGPKVLAFTGGDGVALAKVLKDFIKKHPELRFEQAYLEGQILEAKEAEKIADMPSRDELIAKLVNLLHSPIRRLAVALNAPLQQFANVLGQIADKGGETAESEEAQAAQEAEKPEQAEEPQQADRAEESEEPQGDEEAEGSADAGAEVEQSDTSEETKETQES